MYLYFQQNYSLVNLHPILAARPPPPHTFLVAFFSLLYAYLPLFFLLPTLIHFTSPAGLYWFRLSRLSETKLGYRNTSRLISSQIVFVFQGECSKKALQGVFGNLS